MERCSCFRRHTSHIRVGHFHRATACQCCVFLHIQRFRTKRCSGFRGQDLRIQRRHAKRSVRRFDRRATGFRLQRANRRICLCSDFRIACRSRERARVYAARCRFCGKRSRGHVIQLRFVLARQRRFASRSELLDVERASGICRHTSHGRFAHFHRAAACQTSCASHAKRCRRQLPARVRGQGIRMGFRKNHIATAGEFRVFLRVQRSHVKFAVYRFDRRAASFCLQRANRRIRLRFDFRIACRSRERSRVYAARCRFCGKRSRGHVIQLRFVLARQRRFASRSELLDVERASGICRHTSHGRFAHFHRAAACQTSCASHAKRCRRQLPARVRGQGIRMGFRKNHIAAA